MVSTGDIEASEHTGNDSQDGKQRSGREHKLPLKNGSFLADKPRISWGQPDFKKPLKPSGLGYDHRAGCQRLEISGVVIQDFGAAPRVAFRLRQNFMQALTERPSVAAVTRT
jgi:hypothetical protein